MNGGQNLKGDIIQMEGYYLASKFLFSWESAV